MKYDGVGTCWDLFVAGSIKQKCFRLKPEALSTLAAGRGGRFATGHVCLVLPWEGLTHATAPGVDSPKPFEAFC